MKKKPPRITYIPSPQTPVVVGSDYYPVLDADFDDMDEVVLDEPPLRAFRHLYNHCTRVRKDEEDPGDE